MRGMMLFDDAGKFDIRYCLCFSVIQASESCVNWILCKLVIREKCLLAEI